MDEHLVPQTANRDTSVEFVIVHFFSAPSLNESADEHDYGTQKKYPHDMLYIYIYIIYIYIYASCSDI